MTNTKKKKGSDIAPHVYIYVRQKKRTKKIFLLRIKYMYSK